jgi:hypothetical protein
LRHAGRIGPDGVMLYKRHPLVLIDRHNHEDRGRDADQGVSTKTGGATVKGSLKPDQRSDYERARHSADDYEIIVSHVGTPSLD